jgi:hypothetical protein
MEFERFGGHDGREGVPGVGKFGQLEGHFQATP